MSKKRRFIQKMAQLLPTQPFDDAEEAWFWYAKCQRLRNAGVKPKDIGQITGRPCDPDDLYRAVSWLQGQGRIGVAHVGVLGRFGFEDRPPDPRCRQEERAARLWDEALDRLTTVLRKKGIVRNPVDAHPQTCGVPHATGRGSRRI